MLQPCSDVLDLRFFSRENRPPMPFQAHRELVAMFDSLLEQADL
jgi:hypothetical protein